MTDVSAQLGGSLATTLRVITLIQMIIQARWDYEHPCLILPHITQAQLHCFK